MEEGALMPKKLCQVDGTHDKEIEFVYLDRVTDVTPNEPVLDQGIVVGYRVRVSAAFDRLDKAKVVLTAGLIDSGYSSTSVTQRSVAEALKAAVDVATALVARKKKEWADYPVDGIGTAMPQEEKSA